MFSDLIALFDGWYIAFIGTVKSALQTVDPDSGSIIDLEIWSAYVPWEQIIAAVILVTFIICFFKFLRCVLCKML